ncbi:MAG: hypothetical protein Q9163_003354 [Psora crenata]
MHGSDASLDETSTPPQPLRHHHIPVHQFSRFPPPTAGVTVPTATEPLTSQSPLPPPPTPPPPHQSHKRARLSENNGPNEDEHLPRKKRRLRLYLITSKLSKPYAVPPTFIPSCPAFRAGIWARHRAMRRDLLRKAAVFNSIALKRRSSHRQGLDHRQATREASLVTCFPPRPQVNRRSLSPGGRKSPDSTDPGEYSAFDAISIMDDEEDDDLEGSVYSDLNVLRNEDDETVVDVGEEDHYSFDSFDGGQIVTAEEGSKAIDLVMEIERKSEVSFAPGIS